MQIIDLIQELHQHELLQRVYVEHVYVEHNCLFNNEKTESNTKKSNTKESGNKESSTEIHSILETVESLSAQSISKIHGHISGISRDSQNVSFNDVFVCIEGASFDGHKVAHKLNVSTILCEKDIVDAAKNQPFENQPFENQVVLLVENTRRAMGIAAALLYQKPAESLLCIGITGTNGKTTTVSMIEQLCNMIHIPIGTIGTMGHKIRGKFTTQQDGHTTPESPFLQKLIHEMKEQDCAVLAMEVSSIGLDMERLAGLYFDVAAFGNFSRDHLGFHGSMENYAKAKQKLFTNHLYTAAQSTSKISLSILNHDDAYASLIGNTQKSTAPLIYFGKSLSDLQHQHPQNCHILSIEQQKNGLLVSLRYEGRQRDILIPLIGVHNVYNAILAFLCIKGIEEGLRSQHLLDEQTQIDISMLEQLTNVRGRLEKPLSDQLVFVDYAHTPDALQNALQSLRQLQQELKLQCRLMVVFGCGGNRDKGKRPEMGKIACEIADVVVVTSDNPRDEEPLSIIDEILLGINTIQDKESDMAIEYHSIVDRNAAISFAMKNMKEDDILLIAGKGHETYQEVAGKKIPFDDVQVVVNEYKKIQQEKIHRGVSL